MPTTLEQVIEIQKTKELSELDTSVFSQEDVVNLILQRSEVLSDIQFNGRIIRAWSNGDEAPILNIVSKMGDEIIKRAIGCIYLEYLKLKPLFLKLKPKKVCDIGCGYAIFDLFVAADFGSDLILVDLENNGKRHFGFKREGSAYSNLSVAKKFLIQNGISEKNIQTINPNKDNIDNAQNVDLAVSFLSCGFHYPWTEYESFFKNYVVKEGSIFLDVRENASERIQKQLSILGDVSIVDKVAFDSADRLHIQKIAKSV